MARHDRPRAGRSTAPSSQRSHGTLRPHDGDAGPGGRVDAGTRKAQPHASPLGDAATARLQRGKESCLLTAMLEGSRIQRAAPGMRNAEKRGADDSGPLSHRCAPGARCGRRARGCHPAARGGTEETLLCVHLRRGPTAEGSLPEKGLKLKPQPAKFDFSPRKESAAHGNRKRRRPGPGGRSEGRAAALGVAPGPAPRVGVCGAGAGAVSPPLLWGRLRWS